MYDQEKIQFVVPAAPGFYVLSPCHDEDGAICEVWREPVVGWALDALGGTLPVTPQEVLSYGEPAILYPDGRVRSYDSDWPDEAAWLSWAKLEKQKAKVRHG